MFSEYASKFLAQSQSRISSFGQQQPDSDNNNAAGPFSSRIPQGDWFSRPGRPQGRSFLSRGPYTPATPGNATNGNHPHSGNPYQSTASRFGFASRISAAQDAPLFHSVASDFRDDDHGDEDDDDYEDDREAKDLFALQRSRRVAAASKLAESSETDNDASQASLDRSKEGTFGFRKQRTRANDGGGGGGMPSSWGGARAFAARTRSVRPNASLLEEADEEHSMLVGQGKGKMVDVGLESQIEDYFDEGVPGSLLAESLPDPTPPAFQQFKSKSSGAAGARREDSAPASEFGGESRDDASFGDGRREAGGGRGRGQTLLPATLPLLEGQWFKYDGFFACAYMIAFFAMLSTFVLVWLHTEVPSGPIGDTVYFALSAGIHMLAVDTLVATVVGLFWLAALRSFVRPLVITILLATPVVLIAFSLYPFISSYGGDTHGGSLQDAAMRWASVVPAVLAAVWIYVVWRSRRSIQQAVEILEFASRILAANPSLVLLGLACLVAIVAWTWIWLVMFNRIFLEGHFSRALMRWVMSVSSWWLGAWFVFMHMWTVSIITTVQQATTAATVSQWYFHRNAGPALPSNQIVLAALQHSLTKIFGSICQSTLLSLLVRVPLLVLPNSVCAVLTRLAAFWVPAPIAALTNPLTVVFAAVHSQGLAYSAKGLTQMEFLSPQLPTTTLMHRSGGSRNGGGGSAPLLPYRLSKTILAGTRYLMATALGFAGWVIIAKNLRVDMPDGLGWRGSAYAYVVGIVASFIGLYIMGTMEGVLSGVVDAVVVCYGSERRMLRGAGGSAGAYCMEAAYLFGDRRRADDLDDEEREGLM